MHVVAGPRQPTDGNGTRAGPRVATDGTRRLVARQLQDVPVLRFKPAPFTNPPAPGVGRRRCRFAPPSALECAPRDANRQTLPSVGGVSGRELRSARWVPQVADAVRVLARKRRRVHFDHGQRATRRSLTRRPRRTITLAAWSRQ
jgi:hypothetical protein